MSAGIVRHGGGGGGKLGGAAFVLFAVAAAASDISIEILSSAGGAQSGQKSSLELYRYGLLSYLPCSLSSVLCVLIIKAAIQSITITFEFT